MSEEKFSNKAKAKVEILGEEYVIKGNESAEYISNLASFVDEHMQEIKEVNNSIPRNRIMVLGAMNLANKLYKVQDAYKKLEKEYTKTRNNYEEVLAEYRELKENYQKIQEEYNDFLALVEKGELD
ncbi:cell division protein ZapA [Natroniella sulfidigena]|uniref:cell division protein ZapA n=1 Tax=Natroniella sulfidigena TaxID=723921 RepID=UPI00200B8D17|nr:cell division protein ZapA [Natroniella sulfidigena]MCK8818106.1 cell division protein ZapA [Natroniella sulfidigena]